MSKGRPDSDREYVRKIEPGLKGVILVEAGANKGSYPTEVDSVGEDGTVVFMYPILKGALLPAYRSMEFKFSFDDGGALYVFGMSVVRSIRNKGVPLLCGEIVADPVRIQRRNFLRMACKWSIKVFHLDEEMRAPLTSRWLPATALDISLRGTRFKIFGEEAEDVVFTTGDKVMVHFDRLGHECFIIGTASRVVRNDDYWEVGVSFDSVAISIEKKLFEYIRQCEIMGRDDQ